MKAPVKTYAEALQGTKQPPETTQKKGKNAPKIQAGQKTTTETDSRTVIVQLKKGTETPDFQGL